MDRCALFVDAGYVLADGAMAVHGTRRRESVSWDYPGLLQLLANLAMERSRMPLLRCYWYDSTVEGRRSPDHDALADLPGVKLRLAKMRPGRREGVEGEIHRDLTTLARNKAVSDAMVVSAEEDLAQVIADVQDLGMRVTLLHIATDGNSEIPRALRQECDDIVQISAAQLGPFAELISGAEPPRRDEADRGLLALHAGSNGNANGYANGHANARALLERAAQHAAERGEEDRAEPAREPAAAYDAADGYRPLDDYQTGPDYSPALAEYGATAAAPSVPDFTPAPVAAPAPIAAVARPEFTARAQPPARPDGQFRPELPEPAAPPVREELYVAAPVAVAPVAEEHLNNLNAERTQARPIQEPAALLRAPEPQGVGPAYRPAESGYNPEGLRDQYQLEAPGRDLAVGEPADRYQPVPVAGPVAAPAGAEIRRLPVPTSGQGAQSGGQPALDQPSFGQPSPVQPSAGQPTFGQPSFGQPSFGQPSFGQPQAQGPAVPGAADFGSGPSPQDQGSGGQPIAPVLPMEQPGQGYGANRGPAYGGPRPVNGPVALVGQPSGTAAHGGPVDSGQPVRPGQPGQPGPDGYPPLSPVAAPSVAQPDGGGAPGYSGGQSGVSLADAVQSAHEEGQAFGESVARDAPALWLEAVVARKPRMPSDLEARLLQGSALPIDFLLHDEVRHALRRGFWDALEHARR